MKDLSIRVRAVPGRTVFVVDDAGRPAFPMRLVGSGPDGDLVPAARTADDRLIAKSQLIRAALQSGDLIEVPADEASAEDPAT